MREPVAKNAAEKRYIRKRQIKAFCNSLAFYICRVFPIKKNLVAACTFEGRGGFGCNPKYIVEKLHEMDDSIEFVWLINKDVIEGKTLPSYIRKVPNTLWNRAYWLGRSAVWIDNYRKPYGTVKRKGQYYVNTWHANMGFKNIGLWRGDAFSRMAYLVSKNDSDMIDDVVVESNCIAEYFRKGLVYDGSYIMSGQPRCDILYGDRSHQRNVFCEKHNISKNSKIVMFAPTFREGAKNGKRYVFSENWSIDFERLIESLTKRFGGEWYMCMRVHPQLAGAVDEQIEELLSGKIINASDEDDMYEVLAAMDALVTDYSSVAFDAACCGMPVFIYADDIEQYKKDRGSLIWDISSDMGTSARMSAAVTSGYIELPFAIAGNNDELTKNILGFNENEYHSRVEQYGAAVGLIFDGKASQRVADVIEGVMS